MPNSIAKCCLSDILGLILRAIVLRSGPCAALSAHPLLVFAYREREWKLRLSEFGRIIAFIVVVVGVRESTVAPRPTAQFNYHLSHCYFHHLLLTPTSTATTTTIRDINITINEHSKSLVSDIRLTSAAVGVIDWIRR